MFAMKTLTGSPVQPEQPAQPEMIKATIDMQPAADGWYCRVTVPCGAFVAASGLVPLEAIAQTRALVLAARGARRLEYAKADACLFVLNAAARHLRDAQRVAIEALKGMPLPTAADLAAEIARTEVEAKPSEPAAPRKRKAA
jgi:hypothetical protein